MQRKIDFNFWNDNKEGFIDALKEITRLLIYQKQNKKFPSGVPESRVLQETEHAPLYRTNP